MADTKMTKTIGEHWVCAALAWHGWTPVLTRDAIERTDILAVGTYLADRPRIEVQVKTVNRQRGDTARFPLGAVADKVAKSDHEWFTLVILLDFPSVRTFVVPRDHVCAVAWIETRQYNLGAVRLGWDIWKNYEDRWDLLSTPTIEVPVLLPKEYREMARPERAGLPPGHPWIDELPQW